jgi:hypothetical protein
MNEGYLCPYLSDATINDTLCCCYYSVELNLTQVRGPLNIHAEFVKKLLKISLLLMFVASIEDCCSIEDKLIELSIMPLDPVDE